MKKIIVVCGMTAVFIISSFGIAFANPGKENHGQAKKQEHQAQVQKFKDNEKASKGKKDKEKDKDKDKEERDKQTTPSAIITTSSAISTTPQALNIKKDNKNKAKKESLPPVVRIGNLQIPSKAVVNGLKASMTLDKTTNTITISKNGITIKFVGDSKVYVNNVEVNIANIKGGKGRLVPMNFIEKTLKGKIVTTDSGITTTTQAISIK